MLGVVVVSPGIEPEVSEVLSTPPAVTLNGSPEPIEFITPNIMPKLWLPESLVVEASVRSLVVAYL